MGNYVEEDKDDDDEDTDGKYTEALSFSLLLSKPVFLGEI
jgi:hypothetical protein